jgi:hypothetical protein
MLATRFDDALPYRPRSRRGAKLLLMLHDIHQESAIYLMVRRHVTDVLLCVGNSMMGDDGAGPLLAEMCAANPQGNWVVIDGGSAPENDIVAIRELRPQRLLIVDATDMGLNPVKSALSIPMTLPRCL